MAVNLSAATDRLLRFLAVPGITGEEAKIGKDIVAVLKSVGVKPAMIQFDNCHAEIPLPTQTGNLIVQLPGRGSLATSPRIMFSTHMDTVPLCAGAKPKLSGKKIVNEANTALGGDNRTGCAVLVTLAAELLAHKPDHPPITLLFTVREESGLFGARHLKPEDLGGVVCGFNFDGRSASDVIVGAVGADRWEVEIHGKASHAGVAPERGISSTMILSKALSKIHERGWWGKVVKDGHEGTSNVGYVGDAHGRSGGDATNVVTDFLLIKGESRSHDMKFVKEITAAYKLAFTEAAAEVVDHEGKPGKVKFTPRPDYHPFRIKDNAPVVVRASAAIRAIGREPNIRIANGGLDANWFVKHGIPTVTFGAGQNDIHTVKEWVDLVEFHAGCELAYAAATTGA